MEPRTPPFRAERDRRSTWRVTPSSSACWQCWFNGVSCIDRSLR